MHRAGWCTCMRHCYHAAHSPAARRVRYIPEQMSATLRGDHQDDITVILGVNDPQFCRLDLP
jgi:hypothetical protein